MCSLAILPHRSADLVPCQDIHWDLDITTCSEREATMGNGEQFVGIVVYLIGLSWVLSPEICV